MSMSNRNSDGAPLTAWWLSRYRMMSAVRRNSSVPTTRAK